MVVVYMARGELRLKVKISIAWYMIVLGFFLHLLIEYLILYDFQAVYPMFSVCFGFWFILRK